MKGLGNCLIGQEKKGLESFEKNKIRHKELGFRTNREGSGCKETRGFRV